MPCTKAIQCSGIAVAGSGSLILKSMPCRRAPSLKRRFKWPTIPEPNRSSRPETQPVLKVQNPSSVATFEPGDLKPEPSTDQPAASVTAAPSTQPLETTPLPALPSAEVPARLKQSQAETRQATRDIEPAVPSISQPEDTRPDVLPFASEVETPQARPQITLNEAPAVDLPVSRALSDLAESVVPSPRHDGTADIAATKPMAQPVGRAPEPVSQPPSTEPDWTQIETRVDAIVREKLAAQSAQGKTPAQSSQAEANTDRHSAPPPRPMTAAEASVIGKICAARRPTMIFGTRLR